SLVSWIKHSVDRFVIVSIFIPKLRLILILNSFLGSSDSLVFSELFHSLAPRPLAARSLDLVGLGGKSAADKGKDTRDYLAAAFPELNAWERAGADASSAGMVDAGFENQK